MTFLHPGPHVVVDPSVWITFAFIVAGVGFLVVLIASIRKRR